MYRSLNHPTFQHVHTACLHLYRANNHAAAHGKQCLILAERHTQFAQGSFTALKSSQGALMSPLKLFTLAPRESQFVLAVAELHNHLGFENSTEQDLIAEHGTANVRCLCHSPA